MRIGRFRRDGAVRIGVFDDEVRDVTDSFASFEDALEALADGEAAPTGGETYSRDEITHLPPTTPTRSAFAVALNYRSHVDETDTAVPERPLVFLKLYRSLVGHEQPIAYHTGATGRIDYEAELAAVIGKSASNVDEDEAIEYVAGYTMLNDVSARDVQWMDLGDGEAIDWFSAKAMERTSPLGPHVTSKDAVGDPMDLHIESRVNGELMQDEDATLMIRSVSELIAFVSSRVTLQPGDVIATGTPEGVGEFQDVALDEGDTVDVTIDGLGTLSNTVERE